MEDEVADGGVKRCLLYTSLIQVTNSCFKYKEIKMQSRVTISGNIVSELSEKIPSNIIALNELIKNAYDAGAPSVEAVSYTHLDVYKRQRLYTELSRE